ncbi:MAG TPA: hypothetical protein VMX75_06485 [Spirochaetia bacterium]|nr:hypothetical protein [Spirochaetia bacterium]
MKGKRSILYAVIPILYLSVIGVFLYLQFSSLEPFTEQIGNLYLDGARTSGLLGRRRAIKEIRVRYKGLVFPFSTDRPLLYQRKNGGLVKLTLNSYHLYPGGVELVFEKGVRSVFELEGSFGEGLSVKLPEGRDYTVLFPFDYSGVQVQQAPGMPIFAFKSEEGRFFLTVPPKSETDFKKGYFRLPLPSQDGDADIRISQAENGTDNLYLYWFSRNFSLKSEEDYKRGLTAYLDRAYEGWDGKRYVKGEGLWSIKGQDAELSEDLCKAWIAESLRRGGYGKAAAFISAAMDIRIDRNPKQEFLYLASPYIGRLKRFNEEYFARLPERSMRIENFIRKRDSALFKTEDLIEFFLNANLLAQMDELVSRLVVSIDIQTQPMEICLGMLTSYVAVSDWYEEGKKYFSRFEEVLEKRIYPGIRSVGDKLFLEGEKKDTADILNSIKAGSLLARIGVLQNNALLRALGRTLILSSLTLGDDLGFLPQTVAFNSVKVSGYSDRVISPEAIYDYVTDWPYRPRARPLYPKLNPGVWIWTAAELKSVTVERKRYEFVFSFPVGSAHYIMVQGIEPFASLELKGVPWNSNEQYFAMVNGWSYDSGTSTLYIKLRHDAAAEKVVINYAQ